MHAADDRRQVMLAMRLEADVAQHHDFVVTAGLLEGALEVFARIVVVAGKPFLIGAHDACRRGRRPSRSGSSPAQRISVRTAASASARDGRSAWPDSADFARAAL